MECDVPVMNLVDPLSGKIGTHGEVFLRGRTSVAFRRLLVGLKMCRPTTLPALSRLSGAKITDVPLKASGKATGRRVNSVLAVRVRDTQESIISPKTSVNHILNFQL